jgi:four helix bundle protein
VAANYHAACRGRSRPEFIAKLGVANEESDETVLWLTTLRDSGMVQGPELDRLLQEAIELRAIISSSRATAKRNWEGPDDD